MNRDVLYALAVSLAAVAVFAPHTGASRTAQSQQAGLRIVVIEGEDAVNIIQQKTAVAPVVEVRDRNDLPVAGAAVTFTISGGNSATFAGGLQTLTVTTNAAGRAVAGVLNPLGSGAFQINVQAAFQGQTAAATIAQANVLTAAGAATGPGSGSAAGGTAAGGGGGLSNSAIVGIAGGAAGAVGAVVALKAASSDTPGNGRQEPLAACAFTVTPTSVNAPGTGGSVPISVTLQSESCEPKTWTASSNAAFILLGGGNTQSGNGSGIANMFVEMNPQGNSLRVGTVTIAGQTVTVTQSARCLFTVAPTTVNIPASGGSATVNIIVSPSGCENAAWQVDPQFTIPFVTVNPTSGIGTGSVTLAAPPNPNQFGFRSGALSIAGQVVNVIQAGN